MIRSLAPFHSCLLPFPTKLWRGKVEAVHDGDTLSILVDRGGSTFTTELWDIRFASLNAYELQGPGIDPTLLPLGRKARDLTKLLCQGRWCYLLTQMDPEKYGRILGDPFPLQDDGSLADVVWELYTAQLFKPDSYHGPLSGPRDVRKRLP